MAAWNFLRGPPAEKGLFAEKGVSFLKGWSKGAGEENNGVPCFPGREFVAGLTDWVGILFNAPCP